LIPKVAIGNSLFVMEDLLVDKRFSYRVKGFGIGVVLFQGAKALMQCL
jgi:hypothetical protein